MSHLEIYKTVETTYAWESGVNNSPSLMLEEGQVIRTNWFNNPGFEGPNLDFVTSPGGNAIYRTTFEPFSGTYSLYVVDDPGKTIICNLTVEIPNISIGDSVRASIRYKAGPQTLTYNTSMRLLQVGSVVASLNTPNTDLSWRYLELQADNLQSTNTLFNLQISVPVSASSSGQIYVDEVLVEKINPNAPTGAYFDGSYSSSSRDLVRDFGLELVNSSLTLDSNSLDSSDLSGSIGTFSATAIRPESTSHALNLFGPDILARKRGLLTLQDGHSMGVSITSVAETDRESLLQISGATYALPLVNFNRRINPKVFPNLVQALEHLIFYTVITELPGGGLYAETFPKINVFFGGDLYDIVPEGVVVPGLYGDGWQILKQFCAAHEILINVEFARVTFRTDTQLRDEVMEGVSRGHTTNEPTLAQFVEVVQYNYNVPNPVNSKIPVYPPGGWSEDVEILTVNAGETTEYTLELSAFAEVASSMPLSTFIPREQLTEGYTVIADDGLPLNGTQWLEYGGRLEMRSGDDYSTIIVSLRGPENFRTSSGEISQSFSIALASDGSGSRYSTLRIEGEGFTFDKEVIRIPTGVSAQETATEVGVVIDNPFISNRTQAVRAAVNAAVRFSGYNPIASGENPLTEQAPFANAIVRRSGRPYRIMSTTQAGGTVSWEAQDALNHKEVEDAAGELTFADVQAENEGYSHFDVMIRGARY